jgi:hypothetical protein
MAKKPKLYKRLSRPAMSVGTYSSLWLGPDHLLLVVSNGYTEEYRRILLRDIRGIFTISASARSVTWQIIWIALMVICGLVALFGAMTGSSPYISSVLLVLALVGLIWNMLLGEGCKVYAVTGVQTVQLPSLIRWKKARKVLHDIEPLITAAQRDLMPVRVEAEPPMAAPPPAMSP